MDLKRIKKLRDKGETLQFIGNDQNVTSEAVRLQLKNYNLPYCKKHKKRFSKECYFCQVDNEYKKKIDKLSALGLLKEIRKLSKPNRKKEIIIQKIILIRKLYNPAGEFNLSFPQIGKLMRRHYSSIINLYYSKKI